jgi:hypothetical protein
LISDIEQEIERQAQEHNPHQFHYERQSDLFMSSPATKTSLKRTTVLQALAAGGLAGILVGVCGYAGAGDRSLNQIYVGAVAGLTAAGLGLHLREYGHWGKSNVEVLTPLSTDSPIYSSVNITPYSFPAEEEELELGQPVSFSDNSKGSSPTEDLLTVFDDSSSKASPEPTGKMPNVIQFPVAPVIPVTPVVESEPDSSPRTPEFSDPWEVSSVSSGSIKSPMESVFQIELTDFVV